VAGGDLALENATDTRTQTQGKQTRTSGGFASGGSLDDRQPEDGREDE
jgi:hypothetical protein